MEWKRLPIWTGIVNVFCKTFVVAGEGFYLKPITMWKRLVTGFSALLLLFPRIVTDAAGWFGPDQAERVLTEAELLAKAAAEAAALAAGGVTQAAEAVSAAPFWPNQVLVSLAGLAVLAFILLPQKLSEKRSTT